MVDNPSDLPDQSDIETIAEPMVEISIHVPNEYVGTIITLCEKRRGIQQNINYITADRVQIVYYLPLSEMVFDVVDKIDALEQVNDWYICRNI